MESKDKPHPHVNIFTTLTLIKYFLSGCSGHRAVLHGEGSQPGPDGRELLHQVQHRRRLHPLAGGDHREGCLQCESRH